jgi:hypothetical protein
MAFDFLEKKKKERVAILTNEQQLKANSEFKNEKGRHIAATVFPSV